jgi:hypothetical protein
MDLERFDERVRNAVFRMGFAIEKLDKGDRFVFDGETGDVIYDPFHEHMQVFRDAYNALSLCKELVQLANKVSDSASTDRSGNLRVRSCAEMARALESLTRCLHQTDKETA